MSKYKVWCDGYGQDRYSAKTVEAIGPQYAAQQWAQWHDERRSNYAIVGGTPATVTVECIDTADESVWTVYGESVPEYTARERSGILP